MLVLEFRKTCLPGLATMGCTGCSKAPSIEFLGTFFPAWMLCILAALALTGLIRTFMARCRLEQKVRPLVVFYPSLTVAFSCLLWLVFYS